MCAFIYCFLLLTVYAMWLVAFGSCPDFTTMIDSNRNASQINSSFLKLFFLFVYFITAIEMKLKQSLEV